MKGNSTMKKIFVFITILILMTMACDLSSSVTPSSGPIALPTNTAIPDSGSPTQIPASATPLTATVAPSATPTQIPASTVPNPTATAPQPISNDTEVTVDQLQILLSANLASGARGSQFPRAEGENMAPWDLTPGHTVLKLEGYRLQGKSHQPQIYVYPAQGYAEMLPGAFESIRRLDNILYGPGGPTSTGQQLPTVPFFNAQPAFASNIQVISFQNGAGVRFLTEYAQYPVSANNHDLFYTFQGVTRDGAYYIIAILPINNPALAETSDAGAVLPTGGVPYPFYANPNADMPGYYSAVTGLLNSAPPELFTPTLSQLDSLIQSIRIIP
jgi:hypothetical protein